MGGPGYLVQVLPTGAKQDAAVGTGFQVSPGLIATASHVLERLGVPARNPEVDVAALGGPWRSPATVVALSSPAVDLAILRSARRDLGPSIPGFEDSEKVIPWTELTLAGLGVEADYFGDPLILLSLRARMDGVSQTASGLRLVKLTVDGVLHGMSGAPVCTMAGRLVGVLTGRITVEDAGKGVSAWAARSEDLVALLATVPAQTAPSAPAAPTAPTTRRPLRRAGGPPAVPSGYRPVPPEAPRVWLGTRLVTNAEFCRFLRAPENAAWRPGGDEARLHAEGSYLEHWPAGTLASGFLRLPVVNVSQRAALAFLEWDGRRRGLPLRLPWSDEWRQAAAAGRDGGAALAEDLRHHRVDYQRTIKRLAVANRMDPNPWGLRDVYGNAADMCRERSLETVALGGSWQSTRRGLGEVTTLRSTECWASVGFRPALDGGEESGAPAR